MSSVCLSQVDFTFVQFPVFQLIPQRSKLTQVCMTNCPRCPPVSRKHYIKRPSGCLEEPDQHQSIADFLELCCVTDFLKQAKEVTNGLQFIGTGDAHWHEKKHLKWILHNMEQIKQLHKVFILFSYWYFFLLLVTLVGDKKAYGLFFFCLCLFQMYWHPAEQWGREDSGSQTRPKGEWFNVFTSFSFNEWVAILPEKSALAPVRGPPGERLCHCMHSFHKSACAAIYSACWSLE